MFAAKKVVSSSALVLAIMFGTGCASTATQESTGQYVDSTTITTNVKAALAGDDLATLLNVEVATFKDVVQLSGFVDTEEEKDRAGEIASAVDGVESVENSLIVKPSS